MRRKIEITFETAQFDSGKLVRGGVIENLAPLPPRTSKCGERNGQSFRRSAGWNGGSSDSDGETLRKLTASDLHV